VIDEPGQNHYLFDDICPEHVVSVAVPWLTCVAF
jgi:hypothetical protein